LSELKVKQSVVINLPAEDSFTYVSDLENLVEWSSIVIAVKKTSQGEMQIGTTWRVTIRFLGRWLENTYVVVEWEAGRQITLKSTSGITPCHFSFTFESLAGGKTNLLREAVINLSIKRGFMDVAEPVLASVLSRQIEHDLLTLKDLLEARITYPPV
jgi:uncharacterized membrane protein